MKQLLIISGKGGTGKTTVAAAFIDYMNVLVFADCDVDAPNLHLVTRMDSIPDIKAYYGGQKARVNLEKCIGCGKCLEHCRFDAIQPSDKHFTVREYACEGCGVCAFVCGQGAVELTDDIAGEQRLYRSKRVFSTAKLRMGRGNSGKLVVEVKKALVKASTDADIAVIDGSPGIGCPVIASVSGVDLALVIAEPSFSGLHDMERILKTADALGARTAVCVNKYDVFEEMSDTIERYCDEHDVPFVGRIPYDPKASEAINDGYSLMAVDCPAKKALMHVVRQTIALMEGDENSED